MSPGQFERYGYWESRAAWLKFAQGAMQEAKRILKPGGLLYWKITETKDGRLKVADIPVGDFILLEDSVTKSKSNLPSRCKVHWLTMRKEK